MSAADRGMQPRPASVKFGPELPKSEQTSRLSRARGPALHA
jgi:hypothetical protein